MKRLLLQSIIVISISIGLIHLGVIVADLFRPILHLDNKQAAACESFALLEIKDSSYPDIMIPHPYFGFLYTPGADFVQTVKMTANSEGFIDREFPQSREPDLVIFAIMGGSAAMSWGVLQNEERVNFYLEQLFNDYAKKTNLNKRFRVLNLAIGGHTQYQATQIFTYYKDLLDGVIMYSGHNKASHANQIMGAQDPIRYPSSFDSLIVSRGDASHQVEVNAIRHELKDRCANYGRSANPILKAMRIAKLLHVLQKLESLSASAGQSANQLHLPKVRDAVTSRLPKNLTNLDYHFSTKPEMAKRRISIMKQVIPIVYTEPILDAQALAKRKRIEFLHVVQPMLGTVKKKLSAEELEVWNLPIVRPCKPDCDVAQYEIDGLKVLNSENEKLRSAGIKLIDLNQPDQFTELDGKQMFLDSVHLTPQGNKRVAQILFETITANWPKFFKRR